VTHAAFVGELDELEISKVARPAGFVKLAALGEGADGGKLTKLGQDEETSSWSGGYFAVILHSVTLDGWVVIGILMIMAVISWMIMVGKARYLSRLEKANRRFRETFVKYVSDPTLLAHEGEEAASSAYAKHSSLYRVYCIAAEELKRRAQTRASRPRPLTAEALAVIRASLDAGQVAEVQRMNRQMVLLTLAIAGGPFLGLLGTVIGVMITFAAIAASGDVNVNAIAPGIAAALAATVAGLIVAIPALFGYNWLLTRIRNGSAELQVFVDELLTRTAEAYRRKADLHTEMMASPSAAAIAAGE
jgi:biopolymer transport protein ExbB